MIAATGREVFIISGDKINSNEKIKDCYKFDLQTKHLTKIASILKPRCYSGICLIGDYIYIVSGQGDKKERLKSCERYCISKN
mgnify:CR=1 FL=1